MHPHGLQPTRFLCPWNYLGENTGVGCHFLLQGILPTQGSTCCLLCSYMGRQILYHWTPLEASSLFTALWRLLLKQSGQVLNKCSRTTQENEVGTESFHRTGSCLTCQSWIFKGGLFSLFTESSTQSTRLSQTFALMWEFPVKAV